MTRSRHWRKGMFACALAGMLVARSMDGGDDLRVTQILEPEQAVSEELMIALGQAKNYHHKADVYLSDGKPGLAEGALRQLLEVPFPQGSFEAQDVRLDARARLAALLLGQGELDRALDVARTGIAAAARESFFVANLHTMEGEIFEARAEALDAADPPDPEAARTARKRALEAYARSIAINERLQERLMTRGAP